MSILVPQCAYILLNMNLMAQDPNGRYLLPVSPLVQTLTTMVIFSFLNHYITQCPRKGMKTHYIINCYIHS